MGIFAQRNKDRQNWIGLTTVELIERTGRVLRVRYLDAIDGTPVLDIKPVFREFMPKTTIRQPEWVDDLMKDYWRIDKDITGVMSGREPT
jgi:tRNA (Thr-GGU) A37 N-methylase